MTDDSLRQYIDSQRVKGVADDAIRAELLTKGWDSIVVHRALSGLEGAEGKNGVPMNRQSIILLLGLGLIFLGALGFLGYGWPDLSPIARFLMIAIPNFCLFLTGHLLAKGDQLKRTKELTYATTGLLLPVTIGTFLYQFGIYQYFDGLLIAYSLLISLPVYIYAAGLQYRHAFLLLSLSSLGILLGLLADTNLDGWRSSGLTTIVGAINIFMAKRAKDGEAHAYFPGLLSVGTVLAIIGWPTVFNDALALAGIGGDLALVLGSIFSTGGLVYVAIMLGCHLIPTSRTELFHQRLLLVGAALIGFSSILSGESQALLSLVGVLLGTALAILGLEAKVSLLKWLGSVGAVMSLLGLLVSNIDRELVIILFFVAGFAAVLGSIMMVKREAKANAEAVEQSGWNIGLISDLQAKQLPFKTGEAPSLITILIRLALVFILWLLIQFLVIGASTYDPGSPSYEQGEYEYKAPDSFI